MVLAQHLQPGAWRWRPNYVVRCNTCTLYETSRRACDSTFSFVVRLRLFTGIVLCCGGCVYAWWKSIQILVQKNLVCKQRGVYKTWLQLWHTQTWNVSMRMHLTQWHWHLHMICCWQFLHIASYLCWSDKHSRRWQYKTLRHYNAYVCKQMHTVATSINKETTVEACNQQTNSTKPNGQPIGCNHRNLACHARHLWVYMENVVLWPYIF